MYVTLTDVGFDDFVEYALRLPFTGICTVKASNGITLVNIV